MLSRIFDFPLPFRPVIELNDSSLSRKYQYSPLRDIRPPIVRREQAEANESATEEEGARK